MGAMPTPRSTRTATFADWLEGARPHTWANAVSPVIAGVGAAAAAGEVSWWRAVLALLVAWALIIGVNFANDYSDGIRGTDDDRSGPQRLTGSGLVPPRTVKYAAFACFGVAGLAGLVLSLATAWWLVLAGVACILGAWFYTGGKNPYGYRGLGEVAVFVFFGLVAVLGTQFTQIGAVTWAGVLMAVSIGAISASVNLANNIRDIPSDSATGKITMAVRLGDAGSRRVWLVLAFLPMFASVILAIGASAWAVLGLAVIPLLVVAARPIRSGATGPRLIPVLGLTGRAMLAWAVINALAIGL